MKKKFLLASLLAVSSVTFAKEVAPNPVVSQEPQIVEVIVVKEAPKVWEPNGNADLSYTYHGKDENSSKEYGRLQFQGKLNFTEQQNIEWRIREYRAFQHNGTKYDADGRRIGDHGDFSDIRLRYHYNYGYLGQSKVNLTHRLEYRTYTGVGSMKVLFDEIEGENVNAFSTKDSQYLDYTARFQFKEYVSNWTPDWFENTDFTLAPRYRYGWDNSSNYYNRVGLNFYSMYQLPWNFSFEFNLYGYYQNYGQEKTTYDEGKATGKTDDLWSLEMEAYLYWNYLLAQGENWNLTFNFEGGYDPYVFRTENISKSSEASYGDSKNSYELYMEPDVKLEYKATKHVTVYGKVHAKYDNWDYRNQSSARDWRWQPRVTAGFKSNF